MQIRVGTYVAEVVDGTLKLLQTTERHLTVVNASPDGTTVEQVPYSSIAPRAASSPLLAATWAGDGYANVDLDCGAQRWNGTKSLRWIRSGFYEAGFEPGQVSSLFRQMRKGGPQSSVGRYY